MENVIEIQNLTKDYGQGRGVFDVSFQVHKGECFGFLGPNGAGKSTTIRHLMGFSVPDSGQTLLKARNSLKDRKEIMQGVSYIPGEVALPDALKGSEIVKEQAKLKGVSDFTFLKWLEEYFEYDANLYCKEMSLGMKRKTALICAFMSDPEILIMDEPSSGLDPVMQERFIELVKMEKKRGKSILLSSHIFDEVDACCDRIAVIKDGRIVSTFIADDLKHKSLKQFKLVYINENYAREAYQELQEKNFNVVRGKEECQFDCFVKESDMNLFFASILRDGLEDFKEKKETLEDYFMSFYKEEKEYGGIK